MIRTTLIASAVLLIATVAPAEIIDQVAVTVDNQVITSSEICDEIRVTAFLNGEKPDFSPANRRQTAGRLLDRLLIGREMELTHFPQPGREKVDQLLKQIVARFGTPAEYQRALSEYGLKQSDVVNALLRQASVLEFIDMRFRPEVQVREEDALQYYENVFLPEARRRGVTPEPSFEDVRDQCEQAVAGQLVDKRVDAWLAEARGRSRILYEEDAFQ